MSILPLTLTDVTVIFHGRTVLDKINLNICSGPKTIILGPNGVGKSLLLRLCHGLFLSFDGEIQWAKTMKNKNGLNQAMVFQKPIMLRRTVRANVDYGLKLNGIPTEQRRSRIAYVLERTGLTSAAEWPARILSVGEQQRLAMARAWALQPEILFLDEPTANLDPSGTGMVEKIIEEIHLGGTKIVMTTHDLAQARRIAEEIIFLHNGKVVEHCSAELFFSNPSSQAAHAFLNGTLLW